MEQYIVNGMVFVKWYGIWQMEQYNVNGKVFGKCTVFGKSHMVKCTVFGKSYMVSGTVFSKSCMVNGTVFGKSYMVNGTVFSKSYMVNGTVSDQLLQHVHFKSRSAQQTQQARTSNCQLHSVSRYRRSKGTHVLKSLSGEQ